MDQQEAYINLQNIANYNEFNTVLHIMVAIKIIQIMKILLFSDQAIYQLR
jgi:hypothetical protein